MKSWYDIYVERMNDQYFTYFCKKYKPFIRKIEEYYPSNFIEIGCGAGNVTKALRQTKTQCKHMIIDSCPNMLSLAAMNNPNIECFILDAFKTNFNDYNNTLVHSHGLLEHFSDEQICRLLLINRKHKQVHYVPSDRYETPSRGDERLMSVEEWQEILKNVSELKTKITPFNDGYDLIIEADRR